MSDHTRADIHPLVILFKRIVPVEYGSEYEHGRRPGFRNTEQVVTSAVVALPSSSNSAAVGSHPRSPADGIVPAHMQPRKKHTTRLMLVIDSSQLEVELQLTPTRLW